MNLQAHGAHLQTEGADRTASYFPSVEDSRRAMCDAVAALSPQMQHEAVSLDESDSFPTADFDRLNRAGVLLAPFPAGFGGLGMGSEEGGTRALSDLLRLLGRGNLAVGRLFEAHVNAVLLLCRFGRPSQIARAAQDAADGHPFALWVTDPGKNGLRASASGDLSGGKAFCSGAGHATRAVVTALNPQGDTQLAYVSTCDAHAQKVDGRMHGMRAAVTGRVSFDGCRIADDDWIGLPGDYLREPDFSAGAWRSSAVTCGGLESLVDCAMRQLVERKRADDPHQQARMGRAWIARETALLWLHQAEAASALQFAPAYDALDIVATVNFARIAIELSCLEAMTLIERSLGLAAFLQPHPVERIRRDLATYLRQPAPDDVLTEATAHIMRQFGDAMR